VPATWFQMIMIGARDYQNLHSTCNATYLVADIRTILRRVFAHSSKISAVIVTIQQLVCLQMHPQLSMSSSRQMVHVQRVLLSMPALTISMLHHMTHFADVRCLKAGVLQHKYDVGLLRA
jgi:hypothetical protein